MLVPGTELTASHLPARRFCQWAKYWRRVLFLHFCYELSLWTNYEGRILILSSRGNLPFHFFSCPQSCRWALNEILGKESVNWYEFLLSTICRIPRLSCSFILVPSQIAAKKNLSKITWFYNGPIFLRLNPKQTTTNSTWNFLPLHRPQAVWSPPFIIGSKTVDVKLREIFFLVCYNVSRS